MVVLRGIHSGCRPHHPLVLDVGTFSMHEVHGVRHSGGEPLGAGDTSFGACLLSPPRTKRSHSHSHSHLCADVHEWRVADAVLSCLSVYGVCRVSCVWVVHRGWVVVVGLCVTVRRHRRTSHLDGVRCVERSGAGNVPITLDPDVNSLGVPGTE
jgi:hypothetical protein